MALGRNGGGSALWWTLGRSALAGLAEAPWRRPLADLVRRVEPAFVLATLQTWAWRAGGATPLEVGDGASESDGAEPGRRVRRLGWHFAEWRPDAPGPVQRLACHCQALPDPQSHGRLHPDRPQFADAWRFEVTLEAAGGRGYVVVGRQDRDGLRLLLRTDEPLSENEQARLSNAVGQLRTADGRGVTLRFDPRVGAAARAAARAVDRRA